MLCAVVGANWGDEGKGRMVDLICRDFDVVCRYQGGNNAGHTVKNEHGDFILNLLPSGIFHPHVTNIMGGGMVIDLEHLSGEVASLRAGGIALSPNNLKISGRATIVLPYHVLLDGLEEDRLGDAKFGSTRRGIAPVYADKYMKKTLRMSDLLAPDTLRGKIERLVEWKNLVVVGGYAHAPIDAGEIYDWVMRYGSEFIPYICDTTEFLHSAGDAKVLFEAQLGALRDIDYGIYPYTSSSSTIAAYAPIGAGVPDFKLDQVIAIVKAYSSCVGEGPFTVEMHGDEAKALRDAGGEYGAATGRPRRVGGFDAVATRYGVRVQGATELALTKLDVLSCMKSIPICVAYEVDGATTTVFPSGDELYRAKPVFEYMDGWGRDIGGCRKAEDLPVEAMRYVRRLEELSGCRVSYVSVGAKRDEIILL